MIINEYNNEIVSIIMPTFNCEKTIQRAIESVYAQSYRNWELVIVDDCSFDSTIEKIEALLTNHSNVFLIKNGINGGSSFARNKGLKNARGRYIVFLDGDDTLFDDFLEKQLNFLKKKQAVIVTASYYRIAANSNTIYMVPKEITYRNLLRGNPISCLTTLYDRKIIGNKFFAENLRYCEDYVFWLDILREGIVAYGNQETLANYFINPNSKSRNKFRLIKYMWIVYHKTQHKNIIESFYYLIRWAFYGLKKYQGVR
jgi:glycosyltransferase involved in cell wall biosynthesis